MEPYKVVFKPSVEKDQRVSFLIHPIFRANQSILLYSSPFFFSIAARVPGLIRPLGMVVISPDMPNQHMLLSFLNLVAQFPCHLLQLPCSEVHFA
jgi:hypothetical protein